MVYFPLFHVSFTFEGRLGQVGEGVLIFSVPSPCVYCERTSFRAVDVSPQNSSVCFQVDGGQALDLVE